MQLIQILLPLSTADADSRERINQVRQELMILFGGLTLYRNAPADGFWEDGGTVEQDVIVVAEVMADELDRDWWSNYRAELEQRFQQDEIVIRAMSATRL
ncbi:hypothetical protein P6U16_26665 (plasmid) [Rhizobium sp. 32-5/1]|uniref:hypothetical protein n=1 Tax=Rhizobium sp. 32-5/1 TaxID=3019602 RepID=UPI00240DD9E5|nr:hypothetical protein [Rhizobium sp. 32-5/1]WEZ85597.1 hypothetical protein P6U16_26665 [Rhizobium sp. 32-5/1]